MRQSDFFASEAEITRSALLKERQLLMEKIENIDRSLALAALHKVRCVYPLNEQGDITYEIGKNLLENTATPLQGWIHRSKTLLSGEVSFPVSVDLMRKAVINLDMEIQNATEQSRPELIDTAGC